MNERQRRFCEIYAACGNGARAAREAGYSERTARATAWELLTNPDILAYIRQLQDTAADARICTMVQVRAYWSDVLRDENQKTADRLKAGELLARAAGAFLHLGGRQDDGGAGILAGQHNGEDVVVVLPFNNRDHDIQIYRDPEELGEVEGWTSGR